MNDKLISTVQGKHFLVLGLGRAGRGVANALLQANASVWAYDDNQMVWRTPAVKSLIQQGLRPFISGVHPPLSGIITSPGFPQTHKIISEFRKLKLRVVDELDFASQFLPGQVIAITGTNGKSTTVALIAALLKHAGEKVFLGGNILPGRPLSEALLLPPKDYYCVEVSSFQLERSIFLAPKIAVLLNITPDHLNRHKTFTDYVRTKAKIFARQTSSDWAVLNRDDTVTKKILKSVRAKRAFFSRKPTGMREPNCAYIIRDHFYFGGEKIAPIATINTVPGLLPHFNPLVENALAAIVCARLCGVPPHLIRQGLKTFHPLQHRLELVRQLNGVYYINNSMCTNPQAGVRSLMAFKKKVILICGGKEKNLPDTPYLRAIKKKAKQVILLGENSDRLARNLMKMGYQRCKIAYTMRTAVLEAYTIARQGDIVLFSPGYASFDMFVDFQERGKAFKHEVKKL